MHPLLNIGIKAARAAGNLIVRYMDRIEGMPVSSKGRNDFVSDVDRAAEAVIIETIRKHHPDHGILAEESGASGSGDFLWIIDPLDGTTNFLHGFPQFAVSIAVRVKGVLDQAVIYDPLRQEMFTASRGGAAMLNNKRIRVSKQMTLEGALLGTGFPFREQARLDMYLDLMRRLIPATAGIRRPGAAALDLAYVACGRLDGFWELGLKPWDIAAGHLLITEAGGRISDLDGSGDCMVSGDVLAGTPLVYSAMLDLIQGRQVRI